MLLPRHRIWVFHKYKWFHVRDDGRSLLWASVNGPSPVFPWLLIPPMMLRFVLVIIVIITKLFPTSIRHRHSFPSHLRTSRSHQKFNLFCLWSIGSKIDDKFHEHNSHWIHILVKTFRLMIRYRDPLAYLPSCGSRDPVSRRGKVSCFLFWFFLTVGHSLSCVDRCGLLSRWPRVQDIWVLKVQTP